MLSVHPEDGSPFDGDGARAGLDPDVDHADRIEVEVEVRGTRRQLRWSPDHVAGDSDAIARLHHVAAADLSDPVGFLLAVRTAFGDQVSARVAGHGH